MTRVAVSLILVGVMGLAFFAFHYVSGVSDAIHARAAVVQSLDAS